MNCHNNLSNPIVNIYLMTHKSQKLYVFVGNNVNDNIRNILNKIENNKIISSNETNIIKKFCNNYSKWIKSKNIKFIFDFIRLDDSINYVKKKMFFIVLIFSVLFGIIYLWLSKFFAILLNDLSLVNYLRIAILIPITYFFYSIFAGYFNGLTDFKKQGILRYLQQILKVIFIIIPVILGFGIMGALFGFAIA